MRGQNHAVLSSSTKLGYLVTRDTGPCHTTIPQIRGFGRVPIESVVDERDYLVQMIQPVNNLIQVGVWLAIPTLHYE